MASFILVGVSAVNDFKVIHNIPEPSSHQVSQLQSHTRTTARKTYTAKSRNSKHLKRHLLYNHIFYYFLSASFSFFSHVYSCIKIYLVTRCFESSQPQRITLRQTVSKEQQMYLYCHITHTKHLYSNVNRKKTG